MKESRKEFIKDLHSLVGNVWKTTIEKEFPKLFKKDSLVVGKWYRDGDFLQCFTGEFGNKVSYGFNPCGNFSNSIGLHKEDKYTPATDKEVEEALIKEAKKRGFKEGVTFKSKWMSNTEKLFDGNFLFDREFELCYRNNNGIWYTLFENGNWAEIVKETITKEQAEKELGKTIIN